MADKTIGTLAAVTESTIGNLPSIADLYDDTKIPVEQMGEAMHMTGQQWKQYAQASVSQYVESARKAEQGAQNAESSAKQFANDAKSQADSAYKHKERAEEAKQAIEDMTVTANTVPYENGASATKSAVGSSFNIHFEIPTGKQGERGPQGPQGIQGPEGPQGISGVAISATGFYAFNVNDDGHLILSYTGDEVPEFSVKDDGHLWMNIA